MLQESIFVTVKAVKNVQSFRVVDSIKIVLFVKFSD